MICEINDDLEIKLYSYFVSLRSCVPYYFHVNFKCWCNSMFDDCDYDGKPLFSHLETYVLINDDEIKGFVQFGLTGFVFDAMGEKDYSRHYAVIRNIHYLKDTKESHMLFDRAMEYFNDLHIEEVHAYFHYFGMSCFARQGKLHVSEFFIEDLLYRYGFTKEHENVYFSKHLWTANPSVVLEIDFLYSEDGQDISFIYNGERIGGCELNLLPNSDVCFLKWICIDKKYSHKGFGTKCMYKLFHELRKKEFSQIDTDTIDNNINAQNFYMKTGFLDMGRMRSYVAK